MHGLRPMAHAHRTRLQFGSDRCSSGIHHNVQLSDLLRRFERETREVDEERECKLRARGGGGRCCGGHCLYIECVSWDALPPAALEGTPNSQQLGATIALAQRIETPSAACRW